MDIFELAIRAVDEYSREFDRLDRRQAQSMQRAKEMDAAMRSQSGSGGSGAGLADEVGDLAGAATGAQGQLAGLADDALALAGGAGRAGGAIAGMAEGLMGMVGVAGIAAAGIGAVVAAAKKLYELGTGGEGLKDQMVVLDGLSSAYGALGRQAAAEMRGLSDGTLTWMQANRLATAAMAADHGRLADSYGELFEVAQMVGRASGEQAESLLPKMVEAASTGDVGKLEQATGGYLQLTEAVQQWSLANDRSFANLTQAERGQVLLNIALNEGAHFARQTGLDMATMAETSQGVGTALGDLGDHLKLFVAGQGWVRRLNEELAGLAQRATGFLDLRNQAAATRQEIELLIAQIEKQNQGTPVSLEGTFAALEQLDHDASRMSDEDMLASLQQVKKQLLDLGLISEPLQQGASALELFQAQVIGLRDATLGEQPMINQLAQIDAQVQVLLADLPALPALTSAAFDASALQAYLDKLREINPNLTQEIDLVWQSVTAYQAKRTAMGIGLMSPAGPLSGLLAPPDIDLKGYWDRLARERIQAETAAARAAQTAATNAQRAWERSYDAIQTRAQRALQSGRNVTQLDWLETQAGARTDAPLEAARRLDAIAQRGFDELKAHPDWAALLAIPESVLTGSEAGLKAWAMRTADQVANLARPDLIDWDAFTSTYEQMLSDENAKKLTLDTAMQKLGEKGLLAGGGGAAQQRQRVAQIMGIGDPQTAVSALGEGLSEAMGGLTLGKSFSSNLNASFIAEIETFKTIGKSMGGVVGGAFVEAVKTATGNIRSDLAAILAPEVAAILKKKSGALP